MSLQMTSYFVFIVEMCREIYTMYTEKNAYTITMLKRILDGVFSYFCSILYCIIILTLNHICQTVYYKVYIIKSYIYIYNYN